MGILHFTNHFLIDISDHHLPARRRVCDPLLSTLKLFLRLLGLSRALLLSLGLLLLDPLVAGLFVFVQVVDELPHSRDGVVPRVVSARGMLLLLLWLRHLVCATAQVNRKNVRQDSPSYCGCCGRLAGADEDIFSRGWAWA